MSNILIIGYGNLLRGDDAIGFYAARDLEQYFRGDPDVEVVATQQLTPELADDVAHSRFVVFVDCALNGAPGAIATREVLPQEDGVSIMHHLTPSALLHAAGQLYGDAPHAVTLTLTGWTYELSNMLSRGAQLRLPDLVREAVDTVAAYYEAAPEPAFGRR